MVRVRGIFWALAFLVAAGSRSASAGAINFTGNVATDFSASNSSVQITPVNQGPGMIDGPTGSTANQLASGFMIQDIRTSYDAASNTLYVGFQGYQNVAGQESIFGDSSGNPNPGLDTNPNMTGDKSVAVQFAPITNLAGQQQPGFPVAIAGIPADKSKVGSGTIDGFTVSNDTNTPGLPQYSFGQQLPQYTGNLAFNPSAAHPDLEFTIKNFSQIPGLNASNGFYIQVYAGSGQDIVSGEATTGWLKIPAVGEQELPEPTTWVVWAVLAGGAAWRFRRPGVRAPDVRSFEHIRIIASLRKTAAVPGGRRLVHRPGPEAKSGRFVAACPPLPLASRTPRPSAANTPTRIPLLGRLEELAGSSRSGSSVLAGSAGAVGLPGPPEDPDPSQGAACGFGDGPLICA
jgi:hypothetical protein